MNRIEKNTIIPQIEEKDKESYLVSQTQIQEGYDQAYWEESVLRNKSLIFNLVDGVYEYKTAISAIRGSYFYGVAEYVEDGLVYRFVKGKLVANYKVSYDK